MCEFPSPPPPPPPNAKDGDNSQDARGYLFARDSHSCTRALYRLTLVISDSRLAVREYKKESSRLLF